PAMTPPIELHRTDRGRGNDAFVFLHYFAGSARAWDAVIASIAPGRRCIAVDLRGFGDSPAPSTGYAVADSADDVSALVTALGLERYVLVGHSMGGKIAMALAARRPAGLAGLVLVAPCPPTPEPMPEATRAHLLDSYGDLASAVETAHSITVRPLAAAALEQVVADELRTSRFAWDAWLLEGTREDIAAAVTRVDVPTLVVAAGEDPVMHRDMLEREVVERIAGARMAVVPGVGHLVPYEAPTQLAALVEGAW
ncbi:MAG TPA: alpha/beta hydrolase, partial [Gemmatimonadaceae bacterium]|nr:alpha/beta hydrolase [Gemmatimonadaceae bacterium]